MGKIGMRQWRAAWNVLRHEGPEEVYRRARRALGAGLPNDLPEYQDWIRENEPDGTELRQQRESARPDDGLISFICPCYNTHGRHLQELIRSLEEQTLDNWELCLADGGSEPSCLRRIRRAMERDRRIKAVFLGHNRGIAGNTAAAAELAQGELLAFLDHDDVLAPFAVYELTHARRQFPRADFFYSDEDKLDGKGRYDPHFKPQWSPDTLRSYNYITHLMAMTPQLYERAGGMRRGYDGSQDHDLALRASGKAEQIVHIPKVLYHWRAHQGSVAGNGYGKDYAFEAGRRAVESAAAAENPRCRVEPGLFPHSYRVQYELRGWPLVSIIIPNLENAEMLEQCISSVERTADGMRCEFLVVDSGSVEPRTRALYASLSKNGRARVLRRRGEFNYSAANNYGALHAGGELLLFLNNDIAALEPGWIQEMASHAQRPSVGAVGAKLLYGDGTVQHAGVVVGMNGWADHVCAHLPEYGGGYQCNHLINTVRNVSAVTGACMMVEREKFEKAGGFEENFVLCGSDVELCLRLGARGWRTVYTPYARLQHLESATRGDSPIPRADFLHSLQAYQACLSGGDPFYSLNLDYASVTPRVTSKPQPPSALNPMLNRRQS